MIVGAAVVEIRIHGSHSLKQRRGVVRSIARRLRNRFNLSIAEVGGQDTWQRAEIGICAAGSDRAQVRGLLEKAIAFVDELHLAEVIGADIEMLDLPHAETSWDADADTDGEGEAVESEE